MNSTEKTYSLSKAERLCGETTIAKLFEEGRSFVKYPLRVVYKVEDESAASGGLARMMVSVPKKIFKRAVKRNRVKRLVREAFRLNKHTLDGFCAEQNLHIAFVYLDKQLPSQEQITRAVQAAFARIVAPRNEKPQSEKPCE